MRLCYEARSDLFALTLIGVAVFCLIKDCSHEEEKVPAKAKASAPCASHPDGRWGANLDCPDSLPRRGDASLLYGQAELE